MPQALWGFGHGRELEAGRFARAVRVEREYNLNVTARILLNEEFTFCPIHDFNELRVARERDRQLLRDELPDNVWMSDSIAIDLDFESLDRPSWTVFDAQHVRDSHPGNLWAHCSGRAHSRRYREAI